MINYARILIVDDIPIITQGLYLNIQKLHPIWDFSQALNGREAIKEAARFQPDLILMDQVMPNMEGLPAAIEIKRIDSEIKIIMFTGDDSTEFIFEAWNAGMNGFVSKLATYREIDEAIKKVLKGELHFPGQNYETHPKHIQQQQKIRGLPNNPFSEREMEVLRFVVTGITSADIGKKLFISKRTVDKHRGNLLKITHLKTTQALINLTNKMGWLD